MADLCRHSPGQVCGPCRTAWPPASNGGPAACGSQMLCGAGRAVSLDAHNCAESCFPVEILERAEKEALWIPGPKAWREGLRDREGHGTRLCAPGRSGRAVRVQSARSVRYGPPTADRGRRPPGLAGFKGP